MYIFSLNDVICDGEYISFARHKNVSCPSHLHHSMEFLLVTEGTVSMTVAGQRRVICRGQVTTVMPYETHSYAFCGNESDCMIMVFTPTVIDSFYEKVSGCVPSEPICTLSEPLFRFICEKYMSNEHCDGFDARSVLYPLSHEIYEKCAFTKSNSRRDDTFIAAVRYIGKHSNEAITLSKVASALGIHHAYLSRLFRENSGMTFTYFLNCLRCSRAALELEKYHPTKTVAEIAYESGFGSIRSFNRVFYELYGMTPLEYTKNEKGRT